jgi:4-hydroxy-2-oxoheptanedioate aldolase
VRNVGDVLKVKDAALYPPEGKRGIGPGRASGFGLSLMERKVSPNKDTVVIIQIETREALENLEKILAVEFYDMVFVGPGDLSMNLGIFGEFSNPILTEEIANIIRKSKEFRKKIGIFAGNVEMAVQWLKQGVDLVTINSELGLLSQYVKQSLSKLETLIREP